VGLNEKNVEHSSGIVPELTGLRAVARVCIMRIIHVGLHLPDAGPRIQQVLPASGRDDEDRLEGRPRELFAFFAESAFGPMKSGPSDGTRRCKQFAASFTASIGKSPAAGLFP